MASCLIPTSDLPVTREESHCLSAVDFPEADFWGVCWLSRHIVGENLGGMLRDGSWSSGTSKMELLFSRISLCPESL